MNAVPSDQIQAAEVVLSCPELDPTLTFFTDILGFRIDTIFPADNPSVAIISGYGLRLRLQQGQKSTTVLRLLCHDSAVIAGGATQLTAPNGTCIDIVPIEQPLTLPPAQPSFVISKINNDAQWTVGRAGMRYRDLIPDRQGGRFIASHIQIPEGGPVPDYVHFHNIHFQMIYCYKGWVRVVYEDQGPEFVMQAGDCVLQPPQIRHRVLESSPGLEVIEIGCPAEHETHADHELTLPTLTVRPERNFNGQRFVYHQVATAQWQPWRLIGFEARDTGIATATQGIAQVNVVRPCRGNDAPSQSEFCHQNAEFLFLFVLQGKVTLQYGEGSEEQLNAGDTCTLPTYLPYALSTYSSDLELLEVTLPTL